MPLSTPVSLGCVAFSVFLPLPWLQFWVQYLILRFLPRIDFFPPPVPFPQLQGVLPDILKPAVLSVPQINAFVLLGEVSCSPYRATAPPSKILQFFLIYSENAQWGSWTRRLQKC